MDGRPNHYLNCAYNRNIDDFDDFIDTDSQLSFDSADNETFVDEFPYEYQQSYHNEDNNRSTSQNGEGRVINRSFSLQPMPRYGRSTTPSVGTPCRFERSTDCLTSTPKKQQATVSAIRHPRRGEATNRRRSFSAPRRRENAATTTFAENKYPYPCSTLRRSKSSLSLRQRYEDNRYIIKSTPASPSRYQRYVTSPSCRGYVDSLAGLPLVTSVSPFHARQRQFDMAAHNKFLRRPYDSNSSFSSTRPLMPKNTAVISPTIYTKKPDPMKEESSEDGPIGAFTIAADRTKAGSWIHMKRQTMPKCTLRISGFSLLLSGTLTCLLCFHIISARGRSLEFTLSLISGFITLCLGFTCVWIQKWDRLPNRNYVSGYVVLSLFSILQSASLWVLDKYPLMQQDMIDIMKGGLYGLAGLSMTIALLGIFGSCCCKHSPQDNRVAHGVSGFTV